MVSKLLQKYLCGSDRRRSSGAGYVFLVYMEIGGPQLGAWSIMPYTRFSREEMTSQTLLSTSCHESGFTSDTMIWECFERGKLWIRRCGFVRTTVVKSYITQVRGSVDPAFENPSKPIANLDKEEAVDQAKRGDIHYERRRMGKVINVEGILQSLLKSLEQWSTVSVMTTKSLSAAVWRGISLF